MSELHDNVAVAATALPSDFSPDRHPLANLVDHPQRTQAQTASRHKNWRKRAEKWGGLMAATQSGERKAYEQLLRELDSWLRRYYARRLPPDAADDARQDALLAIHTKRHAYMPSKPFGPWVAAIARHKWIDRIRDASRFAAFSLNDEIMIEDSTESTVSVVALDGLLRRLKPAQASAIRLVKLNGVSVEEASDVTGQSKALVKVNIHRGLKKLAALVAGDDHTTRRDVPTHSGLSKDITVHRLRRPADVQSQKPQSEAETCVILINGDSNEQDGTQHNSGHARPRRLG
jgi:RNA polymerase sigma factor (sigma-70 family)